MREMWRWPGPCEATSKTLSNSIYFVSSFCRVIQGFRVPTSKKATRCNRVCTGCLCFHVVGVLTEGTGTVKTFGSFGWYGLLLRASLGLPLRSAGWAGCQVGGVTVCTCMPLRVLVQLLKSSDGTSKHNFLISICWHTLKDINHIR